MLRQLKSIARTVAPQPVKATWGRVYGGMKVRRARTAFDASPPGPPYLGAPDLFAKQAARFEPLFYREHPSGGVGAELIAAYPSCFKGKVRDFGDLLVSGIEVCLRKRSA